MMKPTTNDNSKVDSQGTPGRYTVEQEELFARLYAENLKWALAEARRRRAFDAELVVHEALRKAMVAYNPTIGQFKPFFNLLLTWELVSAHRYEVRHRGPCVALADDFEVADDAALHQFLRLEWRDLLQAALLHLVITQV